MVIDFHIHSHYSFDCFLSPSQIIALARDNNIDGFAITDHDTMSGVEEFRQLAPDLYIIAGEEISTKEGDILGLFLTQGLRSRCRVDDIIAEIHQQGGLAILAHPFKWPHLWRDHNFLKKFDAVEIFNARNNIPIPCLENFLAKKAVRKFGLAYMAGSDAHEGFEIGRSKTIFNFSPHEASDKKIKEAILERRLTIEGLEVFLPLEIVSHFSRNFKGLFKR